ncbi:MAG: hypothetical protein AAF364_16700 [Pseudomonadota bacterium]
MLHNDLDLSQDFDQASPALDPRLRCQDQQTTKNQHAKAAKPTQHNADSPAQAEVEPENRCVYKFITSIGYFVIAFYIYYSA